MWDPKSQVNYSVINESMNVMATKTSWRGHRNYILTRSSIAAKCHLTAREKLIAAILY